MVRMQDVADLANVSIATVSFVVNGSKPVSTPTRERVEAAMAELGFTRNVVARALASRRSRILALLFPGLDTRGNTSAMQFVHGAAAGAAERDHHLVVWPVANDPGELQGYLRGGLVDGVLAMEVQLEDPRVPALEAARMPYVLIGRTADPCGSAFADIDFESSTAAAVARLQALGHREIALVLEQPGALGESAYGPPVRVERVYREAMLAADAVPVVVHAPRDPASGRAAATRLLRARPEVTAVVVMNDEAAPGLVRGLQAAGRRVPADVSVLGLSMAAPAAAVCDPMLDHLAPPGEELGRAAVLALIDHLEDPSVPPLHTLLPCTPGSGGSLAPPPPAAIGTAS